MVSMISHQKFTISIWIVGNKVSLHFSNVKFSDAGIQDVSTSISIVFKVEYVNDLTERYESDADESDKYLEVRDRRYSCLTFIRDKKFY